MIKFIFEQTRNKVNTKKRIAYLMIISFSLIFLTSCSILTTENKNPNQPNQPNPSIDAVDVSVYSNLSWTCRDADDDPLSYDVYLGVSDDPPLVSSNHDSSVFNAGVLNEETTYFWKIVAYDNHSNSMTSDLWSFTTGMAPIPLEMIFVQGGTFSMGDRYNEGESNELPLHNVNVSNFYIADTEVTHKQYIDFLNDFGVSSDGSYHGVELIDLDSDDCAIESAGSFFFSGSDDVSSINTPVIEITWFGAVVFCNWQSELDSLTLCYDLSSWNCDFTANGYRLPTEAEWEYAARGGIYQDDNYKYSGTTSNLDDYAWHLSNSNLYIQNVGTKLPNQLGIYDMSGNVWEWCWDYFSSDDISSPSFYQYCYDFGTFYDPTGPSTGQFRLLRGGSYDINYHYCRVSTRNFNFQLSSTGKYGFRCVRPQ
jgi:formylglycine-generating enzyme